MKNKNQSFALYLIIFFAIPFITLILCFLLFCVALVTPFLLIGYIYQLNKKSRLNRINDNNDKKELIAIAKAVINKHENGKN